MPAPVPLQPLMSKAAGAGDAGAGAGFDFFGADHLAALGVIAALAIGISWRVRKEPEARWVRAFFLGMAGIQILNQMVWHGRALWMGEWRIEKHLPLHLCDAAVVATVLACLRPTAAVFETCYLWGLGGALQALFTPDIEDGFPHYFFWQFFITHGGLVIVPAVLAFGAGRTPEKGALWRVLLRTNILAVMAGIADWLTGANYMFLREPPPTGSLLDSFGPWPWYILTGEAVAILLFRLLLLPFRARAR